MGLPASPMDRLAAPPDPRDRRDSPESLPGLAVVAMTAGMTSPEAIAHFGRLWGTRLTHLLGFRDGDTPYKATDSRHFAAPAVAAVEAVLAAWVRGRCPPATWRHLTLDGKALRDALLHLLSDGGFAGVAAATRHSMIHPLPAPDRLHKPNRRGNGPGAISRRRWGRSRRGL